MKFLDLLRGRRKRSDALALGEEGLLDGGIIKQYEMARMVYSNKPPWVKGEYGGSGMGALVASEVARLVTVGMKAAVCANEELGIRDEELGELDALLKNGILAQVRGQAEKGWALGGLVMKPCLRGTEMSAGSDGCAAYAGGCVSVDMYYPHQYKILKYNGGRIWDIVFYSVLKAGRDCYTLCERHEYDGAADSLTVSNRVFKSDTRPVPYRFTNLGEELLYRDGNWPGGVPDSWKRILPQITWHGTGGPIVGYYKPALANNENVDNEHAAVPLARCAHIIKCIDETSALLEWELKAGKARLYVDELAFKYRDNVSGKRQVPDEIAEHVVMLQPHGDRQYFEIFSPGIREQNYLNALDYYIKQLEGICGLARGSFSQAESRHGTTATEVMMTRQRSFAMAAENQRALAHCIRDVMQGAAVLKNPGLKQDVRVIIDFDDSLIHRGQEQLDALMAMHKAGMYSGRRVLMKWFGYDEEEANAILEEAECETELLKEGLNGTDDN